MVTNMLPSLFFLLLVSITPDPTGTRVRDTSHTTHHTWLYMDIEHTLIGHVANHQLNHFHT